MHPITIFLLKASLFLCHEENSSFNLQIYSHHFITSKSGIYIFSIGILYVTFMADTMFTKNLYSFSV